MSSGKHARTWTISCTARGLNPFTRRPANRSHRYRAQGNLTRHRESEKVDKMSLIPQELGHYQHGDHMTTQGCEPAGILLTPAPLSAATG